MSRIARIACLLVLGLIVAAPEASAQWNYPRGYGGYGWGGWGADPRAGYMAGLGSYARGLGVYEVEDAKARAINFQTMLQWNQALRARQKELALQKQQDEARQIAERDARVARMELIDGTTLNNLLMQILDFDPAASKAARSRAPLGAEAIRAIPFEWNSEAITLCLDQMTGRDGLPDVLQNDDRFVPERRALGEAVEAAIKEDTRGDVSNPTMKRLTDAIAKFRARFVALIDRNDPSFLEADAYFNTLGSLARLLHDPSMKKILAQLDNNRSITVGDLIAFMQTYNLRFGAANTAGQLALYRQLVPLLARVRDDVNTAPAAPAAPGQGGKALQSAAKDAFGGIGWGQLDAHARDQ